LLRKLSFDCGHGDTVEDYAMRKEKELEMWANAQRDGRPAEYR